MQLQVEPRLIPQSEFSTDFREGSAVRRKTANRILQQLALVSFRFRHFYGAVTRGVWHLEQNKGRVVALVDDRGERFHDAILTCVRDKYRHA